MTPLETHAYIKGLRSALKGGRRPVCPYDRPKLDRAWRRGYEDGLDNPDDAVLFLKQTKEGGP